MKDSFGNLICITAAVIVHLIFFSAQDDPARSYHSWSRCRVSESFYLHTGVHVCTHTHTHTHTHMHTHSILSMVVPVYNAEVSPKSLRGRLVSLNQLAITAGIMVSFITAVWTKLFLEGWRVALGLQCVLGIILIVGMLFLPETPR